MCLTSSFSHLFFRPKNKASSKFWLLFSLQFLKFSVFSPFSSTAFTTLGQALYSSVGRKPPGVHDVPSSLFPPTASGFLLSASSLLSSSTLPSVLYSTWALLGALCQSLTFLYSAIFETATTNPSGFFIFFSLLLIIIK